MIRAGNGQTERGHVLERLAKQAIKLFIAGPDLDNVLQPVRHRLSVVRLMAIRDALGRWSKTLVAVGQDIEDAAMPCLASFEDYLEAEPAVGIYRLCRRLRRGNRQRTAEVAV